MPIKFSNDKPIFLQLVDYIKSDIISGKFKTNEKLPSVREFALMYSVNPNTIQKALQILEDEKLITTDRTNGKYISKSSKQIENNKLKTINNEIDAFFEKMKNFGLEINEIKELINNKGECRWVLF